MYKGTRMVALLKECALCPDGNKRHNLLIPIYQLYPAKLALLQRIQHRSREQVTRILVLHSKHSICRCPSRSTLMRGTMLDMGHWVIICNHHHQVPAHNGTLLQMNPPVMPEVAGYCSGCIKTYDQIAVETITNYVAWSEYPDETIRDRNVRSRAFVDGFGAALICFKNAGLSPGLPCEMSGVQHR